MATFFHSDLAPDEKVHYSFAGAEFDIEGSGTYETDDHEVIRNAVAHPWLEVDWTPTAGPAEEAAAPVEVELPKTAIDAGLPQTEPHYEGEELAVPVAETLAADHEQGDEPIEVSDPEDDASDDEAKE